MLTAEVIQRIQSLYSKGIQSDDTRLSRRHIYNKLCSVRSRLLTMKANKKQKISDFNIQVLPCVELIEASKSECPCFIEIGCKVLRTKSKLPKPLMGLNNHLITAVTSIDGSIVYPQTSWKGLQFKKGGKYTKSKAEYYIKNNYLYLTDKNGPEVITIMGVFDNPSEVDKFPSACNKDINGNQLPNCTSPLDKEFPLDGDLIDVAIEMSVQELIQIFNSNIEDLTNDTKDSVNEQSK